MALKVNKKALCKYENWFRCPVVYFMAVTVCMSLYVCVRVCLEWVIKLAKAQLQNTTKYALVWNFGESLI